MELNINKDDLLYCVHCEENVTRSTFRRHQLLVRKRKHEQMASGSGSDSDSSDDSASDHDSFLRDPARGATMSVERGRLELFIDFVSF